MKKYLALSMVLVSILMVASGCAQTNKVDIGSAEENRVENQTEVKQDIQIQENSVNNQEVNEDVKVDIHIINPLPFTTDINNIQDSDVAIDVSKGSIKDNKITCKVYEYEKFNLVDMSLISVGDTIVLNGEDVEIKSIERDELDGIIINGGLDIGGYYLITEGDGVFFSIGYSDVKTYHELGELTLELSDDFTFVDATDLDNEPKIYSKSELSSVDYSGTPHNTVLTIMGGKAVYMEQKYTP